MTDVIRSAMDIFTSLAFQSLGFGALMQVHRNDLCAVRERADIRKGNGCARKRQTTNPSYSPIYVYQGSGIGLASDSNLTVTTVNVTEVSVDFGTDQSVSTKQQNGKFKIPFEVSLVLIMNMRRGNEGTE